MPRKDKMIIHGISKLTLLDYPGHTACTLFTGACSFRCPFCQNSGLVLDPDREPVIDPDWLFSFLEKRKHLLQGVCISGGEPTLHRDLPDFIRRIREMGYMVKLDSNGYEPEILDQLLREHLIDAAAMDIKSSPLNYRKAAGMEDKPFDFSRIRTSAELLMNYGRTDSDFYCEFRTTMVRGLQTEEDMALIGEWLAGAPRYFLQHFEDEGKVLKPGLQAMTAEEMEKMAAVIRPHIPHTELRGI